MNKIITIGCAIVAPAFLLLALNYNMSVPVVYVSASTGNKICAIDGRSGNPIPLEKVGEIYDKKYALSCPWVG